MMETWRTISEAYNYEVSNEGNVRNKKTGRVLRTYPNNRSGRPQVTLMDAGYKLTRQVHTLVEGAFGR